MSLRAASLVLLALPVAAGAQTVYQWTDKDGAVNYADQPPPGDVKAVREKRLGSANLVETSAPSYALSKARKDFPVTLYTAPNCEAECRTARDFLVRRGIPYTETPVEAGNAARLKQMFGASEVFVPALSVGSQNQPGFEESAWSRLLDDAGYPRFAAGATGKSAPAAKGQ
jgi:hypothetical protein